MNYPSIFDSAGEGLMMWKRFVLSLLLGFGGVRSPTPNS